MVRRDSIAGFFLTSYVVLLPGLLCPSCATHKDAVELRYDLNEFARATESRLNTLEITIASLDSIVREQHQLTLSMRALVGNQTREQRDVIESITARQDEINYQLKELLTNLQAIRLYGGINTQTQVPGAVQPADTTSSGKSGSTLPSDSSLSVRTAAGTITVKPEDLYKSALNDIDNGNFALAESRFLTFLIQFSDHELAGNAQYWLGETAYAQQKYDTAVTEFDKVLKNYKKSPKIPAALLKKGMAQIELNQKKSARTTLERLVNTYSKTEEAKKARELLDSL